MSELYDWQAEGDFDNQIAVPRSIKLAGAAAIVDLCLVEANQALHNTHLPFGVNLLSGIVAGVITYIGVERNSQSPTFPPAQI
jgi:hypothetical protein